ncbi:MAG: transketolase [Streptosporangiaceae bacterium]
MPERDAVDLRERARFIRAETVRLIDIAKTGHYTSVFSAAEILAALYYRVMRLRPGAPAWPERDRLVLSKGHVAVGVYPILADLGYFDPALLDTYTRLGNPLGDHPDMRHVPGADFSSGSLGHGLSVALGMALAARVTGLPGTRVYALLGDGECNEGQIWEAAMAAAHHRAANLFAILDRNQMSLDGPTEEIMRIEPVADKWRAFGWAVREVDGHDPDAVADALLEPAFGSGERPHLLICHTVKGKGVAFMEGGREWHLGYLAPPDRDRVLAELGGGSAVPAATGHGAASR